ncbi:aldo/keto reductase family domain-containing protein [Ditylenchus destructor]|nr:aldo/keto reductase family domain-containing protein [Ditylenchus destructor]
MASVPTLKLNSGHEMPIFGLGTWLSKPGEVANAVKLALSHGYRLLDCAYAYENQPEIGAALKEVFAEGKIKREDIFITTKVWNTFHSYDLALKNVDMSLQELGLDYLDLVLIHWPTGFKEGGPIFPKNEKDDKMLYSDVDYLDTWKALEAKVKEGKIRSIGLSNFSAQQIERVIDNSQIKPANLQVELHLYFQQKSLVAYCKSQGMTVTAYSPLANPAMPFHKQGDPNVMHDETISQIAKNHNKTNAQVALKALVQMEIAVIPKSVNENRIKENFNLWDFTLTDDEMEQVKKMDRNLRFLDLSARDGDHPHFPWGAPSVK